MKKLVTAIVLCLVCPLSFAQIKVVDTKQNKEEVIIPEYDSTKNFLGCENVTSYTGQTLFVLPKAETSKVWGYDYFYSLPYYYDTFRHSNTHFGRDAEESKYRTKYEDLAEKYFVVDSVVKNPSPIFEECDFLLYLTEQGNEQNKCCYVYQGSFISTFPFLVVSHFNYLSKKYIGKDYLFMTDNVISWKKLTDIIVNKDGCLEFEFDNNGQNEYILFDKLFPKNGEKHLFTKEEWQTYTTTYGTDMMKCVVNGTTKVGMPDVLLTMALGIPKTIHSSSDGTKQYVYGNLYVYVKNGKVTSWNN